jgi:hypothetical protein
MARCRPAKRKAASKMPSSDAGDVVSQDAVSSLAEEQRQMRAALAEYFSILREWSMNSEMDRDSPIGD